MIKTRRITKKAVTIKRPSPIPLTKEGFEKAKYDYEQLQLKREEILIRLQAAREQGDLSENGAYTSAKFELGNTDRELRRLGYLLKYGVVTTSSSGTSIGFGNTITLKNDQREFSFTLVSGFESNPNEKKLSEDSPFGKAVLNKKLGETVEVQAPAGISEWKIIKVA